MQWPREALLHAHAFLQEEQRELAKTIRVSGSILLSTVSNFLDFFKMEAGKQLDVVRTEMNTQVQFTRVKLLRSFDSARLVALITIRSLVPQQQ